MHCCGSCDPRLRFRAAMVSAVGDGADRPKLEKVLAPLIIAPSPLDVYRTVPGSASVSDTSPGTPITQPPFRVLSHVRTAMQLCVVQWGDARADHWRSLITCVRTSVREAARSGIVSSSSHQWPAHQLSAEDPATSPSGRRADGAIAIFGASSSNGKCTPIFVNIQLES